MMKQAKEERLHVRVPAELMQSVKEAADKSGWGVSEQIRFELMQIRGMWKTPMMPDSDSPKRKHS